MKHQGQINLSINDDEAYIEFNCNDNKGKCKYAMYELMPPEPGSKCAFERKGFICGNREVRIKLMKDTIENLSDQLLTLEETE